jgi:cell division protein FtsI (penicillin-binding protein 3)
MAHMALRQAVAEHRAKAGSIVVLDPRSGEILALANLPAYNPNNRVKLSGAQLRNRALTDTFEPGSTFKPFTAALALDQGRFRPETQIQTAPGRMSIGNSTITDAHPHGILTVAEVVQKSSNVGTAKMAATLSSHDMWQTFDALGFGAAPALGFPGEAAGRLRPHRSWRPIEQATMSFGYGIAVSLMQLAHAYTVFAREGDLVPLTLTRIDSPPPAGKAVFTPRTARQMRAMLEMATQAGGTAPKAQIPGYRVAGKTGTARKLDAGSYVERYVASFVGFAPVSDPRLIVAVMIDDPAGDKYYGGEVAAPAFAQVMGGALRALGVKPDAPLTPLQVAHLPPLREGL